MEFQSWSIKWPIYYLPTLQTFADFHLIVHRLQPSLLSFLNYPVVYIQLPILRIVGNIVTGNANQTQMIVDAGVLKYLKNTLLHEKRSIRRETCWIISNIAAGTQQQIEAIILADFIPLLEQVIKNDEPDVYCY